MAIKFAASLSAKMCSRHSVPTSENTTAIDANAASLGTCAYVDAARIHSDALPPVRSNLMV